MKAISLYAPYGTLIACGVKLHETRAWKTPYRGLLAIHQGKRWADPAVIDDLTPTMTEANKLCREIFQKQVIEEAGVGAVVAVARLVDCVPAESVETTELDRQCGDFSAGRWAWRLEDVRALAEPVKVRGQQGLFDVDDALLVQRELVGSSHGG